MGRNLAKLAEKLQLQCLSGKQLLNQNITGCYTSDILTDVLGHAKEGSLWITSQLHKNIVAIAHAKKLSAIVITNNWQPESDVISLAEYQNIVILVSPHTTFETSGIIYKFFHR